LLLGYDTLGAQAYGRGDFREVGVLILRAVLLAAVLLLPVVVAWSWAEQGFLLLGQDPYVASFAARYLQIFRLSIVPLALFEALRRFALSQGIAWPFTAATIASNLFVALAADPMLRAWNFDGSGLLNLGAVTVQALAGMAYLAICRPGEATQAFPGLRGLRSAAEKDGLRKFLKLAVPGVLSMTEWWFWEVTCFRAGVFGAHSLAAHTVAYMAVPLLFQVPRGVQMGYASRAGALLGEGRGQAAKKVALGGLAVGVFLVILDAALMWAAQEEYIAQMSGSSAKELSATCREIWPFVIFFLVVDGLFPLNQGICNIHSHQGRVSLSMILSLWVVGVPVTLSSTDLVSLWRIFPLCYILLNSLLILSYACADWDLAAQRASHQDKVIDDVDAEKATTTKLDSPNCKNLQPQVLGAEDVQNIQG
ncbi:unnamed protein product, partial [Symbiodinium pilosum]